jgi:hypothetical protein
MEEAGLQELRYTCKVLGDSTWDEFRTLACRTLRAHGFDVKYWQAKRGASEEQIAVKIVTTPQTNLCIAAPNGNRLARQEEERKPYWMKKTAGYIGHALATTSERACVFLGDASLCPGLSNAVAYTKLVPMFQSERRGLGISLVSACPGVVLHDDGIHWAVRSDGAVKSLFDSLVTKALDTSSIPPCSSVPLWHWRLDITLRKYYPCCHLCGKMATDAHLDGKTHLSLAGGSKASFDFPRRLDFCATGVAFTKRGDSSTFETTPYLPADHPLPAETVNLTLVKKLPAVAVSFVVWMLVFQGMFLPILLCPEKPIVRLCGAMEKAASTHGSLTKMVEREMHSYSEIPHC